jgi:hypothetical protein
VTTQNTTTTVEIRDDVYGTIPGFWWDWPDETKLADCAEQNVRAERDDRVEQTDRTLENNAEYAALYFVS